MKNEKYDTPKDRKASFETTSSTFGCIDFNSAFLATLDFSYLIIILCNGTTFIVNTNTIKKSRQ